MNRARRQERATSSPDGLVDCSAYSWQQTLRLHSSWCQEKGSPRKFLGSSGGAWCTRFGSRALELGLAGHARNTSDGRVEVVVQGGREAVDRMVLLLGEHPSSTERPGKVVSVSTPLESAPRPDVRGFVER